MWSFTLSKIRSCGKKNSSEKFCGNKKKRCFNGGLILNWEDYLHLYNYYGYIKVHSFAR